MRTHRLPLWVCALLLPACASAPDPSPTVVPPGATVITRPVAGARRGGPTGSTVRITPVPREAAARPPAPPPTVVFRTARATRTTGAPCPPPKPACKPACKPRCAPVLPFGTCCGGT